MPRTKTAWNFKLLYASPKDPAIEADMKRIEGACGAFARTYAQASPYVEDALALKAALSDYEALCDLIGSAKPLMYFYYVKALKSDDRYAESQINLLTERITKAHNGILFFELKLGKLPETTQQRFLSHPELAHFAYFLNLIFKTGRHQLTEAEERIMNLKSLPAHDLWINGFDKFLNVETVSFKGKRLPLAEAENLVSKLSLKDRRALQRLINELYKRTSSFAECELNAVCINKKINDELRGYKEPYSNTILSYQNDEKSVMNLVAEVTKAFTISARFYALKAKLLRLPYLEYADRAASIGNVRKKITFNDAVKILRSSFGKRDHEYRAILERFLEQGQIDVYPKKGKEGGAFCSSGDGQPTFVLLNHVDSMDSVTTFAHEMGHAIHSEYSKSQTSLYEHYTISVAEVASTLFENFAFDEVFQTLGPKERVVALHDRLNGAISTVFRQIAFFNFELELHRAVRSKGALAKEEMAALFNTHMSAYMGKTVRLKDDDGYFYVTVSHFRRFFYVYAYALGLLTSRALYEKMKADPSYNEKIKEFLSAGGSKSPERIFGDIGVDITSPEFVRLGLKSFEDEIEQLERLAKAARML